MLWPLGQNRISCPLIQKIVDPKTFHNAGWYKCTEKCQSNDRKWNWVAGMDRIDGQWKFQISTEYEWIYKLDPRGILDLGNIPQTASGTELFRCDVKTFVTNGSLKVESISIELLFEEQKGEKPLSLIARLLLSA